MKYRIKIITHKSGSVKYIAQFKSFFCWMGLSFDGKAILVDLDLDSREEALKRIDLHRSGNRKVVSIDFEYLK